ncbi:hypothetical protein [Kordia sp.]|uniref:hypothetical protein n=1 Tax=Kordia sp. TaxID=1965332 RepID=UPI003D6A2D71
MIRKWLKKIKDSRELKKSNWGRNYNWYIEYNDEIIGELIDCQWLDMYWDTYIIKSLNEKWDQTLTNPESWSNFKYKNQYYDQYAIYAFPGGDSEHVKLNERLSMRGLYLTEIK